jgi:hypothetical protein
MLPQGGYRNDDGLLAALALPLLDGLLTSLATGEKDMDRHDKGEAARPNVHLSLDDFIVGDFPHVARQLTHISSLDSIDRVTAKSEGKSCPVNRNLSKVSGLTSQSKATAS